MHVYPTPTTKEAKFLPRTVPFASSPLLGSRRELVRSLPTHAADRFHQGVLTGNSSNRKRCRYSCPFSSERLAHELQYQAAGHTKLNVRQEERTLGKSTRALLGGLGPTILPVARHIIPPAQINYRPLKPNRTYCMGTEVRRASSTTISVIEHRIYESRPGSM